MPSARMTGKERILAAVRHEEPDRTPISPRTAAYLLWKYGHADVKTEMEVFPEMDIMTIAGEPTPNYLESYPDSYSLPQVRVEQKKYQEGNYLVVERSFHTPSGTLSDRTKIPPGGREYGISPNPIKTEWLVKSRSDLDALRYLLPEPVTHYDFLNDLHRALGDKGVAMLCVRSPLDHNAGAARNMQDLMADYYMDRPLFDALLSIFYERMMAQTKNALEGGAEWIFGSWYFHSLSSGWSPRIFREVFVPWIRAHVELVHSYGAFYDYYDDGKLRDTMEIISETGVDVLETCTPPPVGDFDLKFAKERIGSRVALKGYVDLLYVMQRGTPQIVEQTVREAMEVARPGGGWIIGTSDSFRENTPDVNMAAYWNSCLKYGVYR